MNNPKKEPSNGIKFTGLGAALGLVFGGLIGILVGNPAVFAGGTMVLGIAIGSALDQRRKD